MGRCEVFHIANVAEGVAGVDSDGTGVDSVASDGFGRQQFLQSNASELADRVIAIH